MLILLYNILQSLAIIILWPLLLVVIFRKKKYGSRMLSRFGLGLPSLAPVNKAKVKTYWLHALSVGEITSAAPLLAALRQHWPECRIVVTVTTTSGEKLARTLLVHSVDHILPAPLDFRPTVYHYMKIIQPDMYIHVETDFWPNLLTMMRAKSIPTILVNGRISSQSLKSYNKYRFFFSPIFNSFDHLCMQTEQDRTNMLAFGIARTKILTLGNLKFDTPAVKNQGNSEIQSLLPKEKKILTAGSTHPGEEKLIITVYSRLKHSHNDLFLVIVPRNPDRAAEIATLASDAGIKARFRSENTQDSISDLLIVDTIGELIDVYRASWAAFVGGSLVPTGGHNPIEPALFGIPVLFGPHMEDFSEIASALIKSGGGTSVHDIESLQSCIQKFLDEEPVRLQQGKSAREYVEKQQGVIDKHLNLIRSLL
ncbi:3-deoxy-D-manno-octulosonic acid transferase [Desulfopila sp. IMCC35008]|uniref:3-deoxy-D-manno-octulosonic acid transferase n=1 Tax=Desulfopila sp. IMCC35008 TaxID=2653858 RepID=UPI0013D6F45A|nr:3-deoxy-D-manno-octulosonic acid transferase [Desulfopila sp. IMCC35008]